MFKNWKTSLVGLVFAAGNLAFNNGGITPDGHFDKKSILTSLGLFVLGLVSKDHDATGGTRSVQQ